MNEIITTPYSYIQKFIPTELSSRMLLLLRDDMIWTPYVMSPKSRLCATWKIHHTNHTQKEIDILLEGLLVQIQQTFKTIIRGVFLNWYKDGSDYCPYHSDNYNSDVYTISLGQSRDLLIKRNGPGKAEKFTLNSGDLYYMSNAIQLTHKHSIPSRKKVTNERISIVFFAQPK